MSTKFNILIVEDNPLEIELIKKAFATILHSNQLNVIQNGRNAIDFLTDTTRSIFQQPDLIILDLNLPDSSGHEILQAIKSVHSLKRIPVVVFTSLDTTADIVKIYSLHANCLVPKPVDTQKFIETVQTIVHFWSTIVELPPKIELS